jgi:hypothetical protein
MSALRSSVVGPLWRWGRAHGSGSTVVPASPEAGYPPSRWWFLVDGAGLTRRSCGSHGKHRRRVVTRTCEKLFLQCACRLSAPGETLILLGAHRAPCRNPTLSEKLQGTSRATGKEGPSDGKRRDQVYVEDRRVLDWRLPGSLQGGRRLLRPGQASDGPGSAGTSGGSRQGQRLTARRR